MIDLNLRITLTPNLEDPTMQELVQKMENFSRYFVISALEIRKRDLTGLRICKDRAPNGMPLRSYDAWL